METVHYCWSCDAHRKAIAVSDHKLTCPSCGAELAADSRLSVVGRKPGLAGMLIQIKRQQRASFRTGHVLAKGA